MGQSDPVPATMPALLNGDRSPILLLSIKHPGGRKNAISNSVGFLYERAGDRSLIATAKHFILGYKGSQGIAATDVSGRPLQIRSIMTDPLAASDVAFLEVRLEGSRAAVVFKEDVPGTCEVHQRLHAIRCLMGKAHLEPDPWCEENVPVSPWLVFSKLGDDDKRIVARTDEAEQERCIAEGFIRHVALPVRLEQGFSGSPFVDHDERCLGMVVGGITRVPENEEALAAFGDLTWYVPPAELARARSRIRAALPAS